MASRPPWGWTALVVTVLVFLLDGTWNLSELALGGSVAGVVVAAVDIFRRRSELRRMPNRNKVASSSAVTSTFWGSVGAGGGFSVGKSSLDTPLDGLKIWLENHSKSTFQFSSKPSFQEVISGFFFDWEIFRNPTRKDLVLETLILKNANNLTLFQQELISF